MIYEATFGQFRYNFTTVRSIFVEKRLFSPHFMQEMFDIKAFSLQIYGFLCGNTSLIG
jgi:hypothetical protein